MLTNQTLWSEH